LNVTPKLIDTNFFEAFNNFVTSHKSNGVVDKINKLAPNAIAVALDKLHSKKIFDIRILVEIKNDDGHEWLTWRIETDLDSSDIVELNIKASDIFVSENLITNDFLIKYA
jgi:hypothetical protein